MASPTQFRHYLIAQDAEGTNIEVVRSGDQVSVLAFDSQHLAFVHCHVLLEPLKSRRLFDERGQKIWSHGKVLLARLLDFGEDEGSAFYITESVDGETLGGYLSRHQDIPVWLAMQLAVHGLQAVQALLEVGDFLPSPVIDSLRVVQTGSCSLQVKLADFRMVDAADTRPVKPRAAKDALARQAQFLQAFLNESLENGAGLEVPQLNAADFAELLQKLLASCGPGLAPNLDEVINRLLKNMPDPPAGDLLVALKPQPLLAALLPSFQEVARNVAQSVRVQSQKLDAGQPYALRGLHLKTGQNVLVEPVIPRRMAGGVPYEILQQVKNLAKAGKFPNLVPITFIEKQDGTEHVAETAVEGVPLNVVLDTRRILDVQEAYLVLAGVDAALAQLEKASLSTPRLRMEDIFLFTGFTKQSPQDAGLLSQKLNEWPGFSIVLRTHPSLHAMAGRGTDPSLLLPLHGSAKGDAEPLWNGAWMAALGCFLVGMPSGVAARHQTGIAETDTVYRLLDDELHRARKGAPSSRASFLARFARVMQQYDLAQYSKSGGFWTELSGSATAQGRAAEVTRAATAVPAPSGSGGGKKSPLAPMPVPMGPPADPEDHGIGFAEALISQQRAGKVRKPTPQEIEESSWMTMHEKRPFWASFMLFFFGSLFAGLALAHLSGRAFWQDYFVPTTLPKVAPPVPKGPEITLPDPKPLKVEKTPAPPPKSAPAPAPTPAPVPAPTRPLPKAIPVPEGSALDPSNGLSSRLRVLRETGGKLTPALRKETEAAARTGNTEAMVAMGRASLRGDGGPVDESAAFAWFEKAAAAGEPAADVPLAECYLQGWGTPPEFARAIMILTKASQNGNAVAKDLLGVCYARGIGVNKDVARAFQLYQEAYKAGVASACGNLGSLYLGGQGVAPDATRAVQLFAEGASKGHAESMLSYARCLESGTGIPASRVEATQWYQQAARLGNLDAVTWCRQKNVAF